MQNKAYDVLCVGLNVVNFPVFPVDASLFTRDVSLVSPITLLPGGDAANQAIVLSRLGLRTALLSVRGEDTFGEIMLSLLKQYGNELDLENIVTKAGHATPVCAMMIRPDGQRHFCSHRGAMNTFSLHDIDLSLLSRTKVVSIGGLCAMPNFDGSGTAAFFKAAREKGVITVADTKSDTRGIGLDGIRETLAQTDFFFPSYDEACALSGETHPAKIADAFLRAGAGHVGIKLGEKGCYMQDATDAFTLPAFTGEVVDTTGAGDNFMAGFITGLLQNQPLRQCCRFANAAASLCIASIGPCSAVTSYEQVTTHLAHHGCTWEYNSASSADRRSI